MKPFITTLLATITLSACASIPPDKNGGDAIPPPIPGPYVPLSSSQMHNLRTLLGLEPSSPFSVEVLDGNNDDRLNAGDIAILTGGINNTETSRRILSTVDITTIDTALDNTLNAAAHKLKAAEKQWQRNRPEHYAYTLQRTCFCPPEANKPLEVRVFQGKVQQATVMPDGTPLPSERMFNALTVEELFTKIRDAIDNKAVSVEAQYDPQYGYPISIRIDYSSMLADEELHLTASGFKIASGLKPIQQH